MDKLSEILVSRGYVHQFSTPALAEITDGEKRTLYWGVDPSANSMHVGQLQGILVLRRFLEVGHKVIFLAGGATGLIGDPGGKNEERPLLDAKTVESNVSALESQTKQLLDTDDVEFVNNIDWLGEIKLLDFLRETGKFETVNAMIKRDAVKRRIEDPERSISYAEFSYMLLQAHDFHHLFTSRGVDLQVGASDQWGNIVSGIDLIKHKEGKTAYGFTWPLLVNSTTGKKFGKSEAGTVWLDSEKTSAFKFYQFWLNTDDESVEEYLKKMTELLLDEISSIVQKHTENPAAREGQRALARAVTELVHGREAAEKATRVSSVLFGEAELGTLGADDIELLKQESPATPTRVSEPLPDVLVKAGLAESKREARQFITEGAVTLNGARVSDINRDIMPADFENAPVAILKRGKRNLVLLTKE